MKKFLLSVFLGWMALFAHAQVAGIFEPGLSVSPAGATAEDIITITFLPNLTCADNGAATLVGNSNANFHGAIIADTSNAANWKTWSGTLHHYWNEGTGTAFTKNANGTWSLTFKPRDFFNVPTATIPVNAIKAFRFVVNGAVSQSDPNPWVKIGKAFATAGLAQNNCGDFAVPFPVPAWLERSLCTIPTPTITAGSALSFCSGDSVTLTSSATTGNLWSSGQTTQSIKVKTAGSYKVVVSANGCVSDTSLPTIVDVRTLPNSPTILSTRPLGFCIGDSVVLKSNVTGSLLWSTGETTDSIVVKTSGNYTLKAIANNCTVTSAPVTVVVGNPSTVPTFTISGDTNICSGSTVNLTSSSATGNIWSNGATTQSITVGSAGSYSLRVVNFGCTSVSSKAVTVTVNAKPLPQTPVSSNGTTLCNGDSTTLSVSGTFAQYLWSTGATTPTINVKRAGNYWVRVGAVSGCLSDTLTGAAYSVSGLIFSPSGAGANDSITIKLNPAAICGNMVGAPSARIHSGGQINGQRFVNTVSTLDANLEPLTRFTQVNGTWTKIIVPRGYYSAKATDTLIGMNLVVNGGARSGIWFFNDGKNNLNTCGDFNIPFPIPNNLGVSTSLKIKTSFVVTPTVSSTNGTDLCPGKTTTLVSSWSGKNLWSNGDTSQTVLVTKSDTLSVRAISAGCTSAPSTPIMVNFGTKLPAVAITASGPLNFCEGDSTILSAPAGFNFYKWSNGATTQSIVAKTSGHYFVQVANTPGCFSDTGTSLPYYKRKGLTFSPSGATADDSLTITIDFASLCGTVRANSGIIRLHSGIKTKTGARWQKTVNANNLTTEPLTHFTNVNGTFQKRILPRSYYGLATTDSVTELDMVIPAGNLVGGWFPFESKDSANPTGLGGTCNDFYVPFPIPVQSLSSNSVNVKVSPAPVPVITASGPLSFCSGSTVTLTSNVASKILWSTGDTTQSITVAQSGTYSVKSATSTCTSKNSVPVVVTVTPRPAVVDLSSKTDTLCEGDSTTISAGGNYAFYRWSNGATTPSIRVGASGTYWVMVANNVNCWSDTLVGGYKRKGVTFYPAGATANDSITLILNSPALCGTIPRSANVIRLHSGVRLKGNRWSKPISSVTQDGKSRLYFDQADGQWKKKLVPYNYFGMLATDTTAEMDAIFTAGDPAGAWYQYDGKDPDNNGCGDFYIPLPLPRNTTISSGKRIVVTPHPVGPTVTASGPLAFCSGRNITLTSSSATANIWSTGDTTRSIVVSKSGTYSVRKVTGRCTSDISNQVTVQVNPRPAPQQISVIGSTTLCGGDSTILSASPGFPLYKWSNGASTQSITVKTAGRYWVMAANTPDCFSDTLTGTYKRKGVSFSPVGAGPDDTITVELDIPGLCGNFSPNSTINRMHSGVKVNKLPRFSRTVSSLGATESKTLFTLEGSKWVKRILPRTYYNCLATDTIQEMNMVFNGGVAVAGPWYQFTGKDSANACGDFNIPFPIPATTATSTAIVINVNTIPQTPTVTVSGSTTLCKGSTITLTSSETSGNLWSTNDTTRSITVSSSGSYSLRKTRSGCTSFATTPVVVTVNSKPAPQVITSSGPTTLCAGDSVTLSAGSGFAQYLWSNGATTQSIKVSTAGRYWVKAMNLGGCWSDTLTGVYKRKGVLLYPAGAGANDTITMELDFPHLCGSLTASVTPIRLHSGARINGTRWRKTISTVNPATEPNTRFDLINNKWVKKIVPRAYYNALASDTITEMDFTLNGGNQVGNWFTFEGKDSANSCADFFVPLPLPTLVTNSTAVTVTIKPTPTAPAITTSGPTTFCKGSTITLTSADATGNIWSTNDTTRSITIAASGSYTLRKKSGNCTSAPSAPVVVTVNDKPAPQIISASGQAALCQGDTLVLSAGTGFAQYLWSNGATSQSIKVTNAGHYWVRASNVTGCWSDTITGAYQRKGVNFYPAGAGANDTITMELDFAHLCGSLIPSVSPIRYHSGAKINGTRWRNIVSTQSAIQEPLTEFTNVNGRWIKKIVPRSYYSASASDTITELDFILNGGNPTTTWFQFQAKDSANSCGDFLVPLPLPVSSKNSTGVDVIINPNAAVPVVTANRSLNLCQGDSLTLTSSIPTGNIWSTGATSNSIRIKAAGSYTVRSILGPCTSKPSIPSVVAVNPKPNAPTITRAGGILDAGTGGSSYVWYINGKLISGQTGQTITGKTDSTYTVVLVDANGCKSDKSTPFLVTGVNEFLGQSYLKISPNPTQDEVKIEGLIGKQNLHIFNALGQEVHTGEIENNAHLNLRQLPAGMYRISVGIASFTLIKN